MSEETVWFVMRSSGLAAWVLLTLTLIWGALVSSRVRKRRWLVDLHPYLATLGLATLVLHIVTAVEHAQAQVDLVDAFVPFRSGWRPVAVGLGVVATWLLALIQITSDLRRRLPARWWRGVHLSSYTMALAMALHGLGAGTDTGTPLGRLLSVALVAVTFAVAALRSSRAAAAAPAPQSRQIVAATMQP